MWGTVQSPPKFSMVLPRKLLVDFKLKGTQWRIFPNVKRTFANLIEKNECNPRSLCRCIF
jgi:hypothetical protein